MLCALENAQVLDIFSFCPAQALGHLECCCRRFLKPVDEGFAPAGSELSLTELAARLQLRHARAANPDLRSYERGENESHMQVLRMLGAGLLQPGVLHEVPVSCTSSRGCGWIRGYERPYEHRTSDADIDSAVPPDARFVLMAARRRQSMYYTLLAWGTRDAVLRATHDRVRFRGGDTRSDNIENGVFYYRWPEHAMGFSSDPSLYLLYADSARARGIPETFSADRLSWNLETLSTGGWRAGDTCDLGNSVEWLKCLYYRM